MVYHAIECALKAYLASKNPLANRDALEDRWQHHRITDLTEEAKSRGLELSTEDNCSLQYFGPLSMADGKGKKDTRPSLILRFHIFSGAKSESPDVLKRIADAILNQVTL
ncbi:hypothetical protein V1283_003536 [Bradyrhizobium sp. AZCC 2262]|uniref:hypothetical protein n=1 Tax=Bradyrhizobium sp. AZCC 2262 TaxID=3117022 RepID=UPI002FEE75A0